MCQASTRSTINTVISKLSKINPAVKQILFKMLVVDVDAPADGDGTNDLTQLKFQTPQSSMSDMPMEQGDDQDQDPPLKSYCQPKILMAARRHHYFHICRQI